MRSTLAELTEWPIAAWVIVLGAALFAGQYTVLRWRWRQARPHGREAEQRLAKAASLLREYAAARREELPARLEDIGIETGGPIAYRRVPRLTLDERLVVLHDAHPEHRLLEFPKLQEGRGVVPCSGRLLVVSQSAFEKLLEADDTLRIRLGLEPVDGTAKNASRGE